MTALVRTRVPRTLYSTIARRIMAQDTAIEQVGFIEPATNPRAVLRLHMMGGEFCGNATRSLGFFIHEKLKRGRGRPRKEFLLEVSGCGELIPVKISGNDEVEISPPVNQYNEEHFRTCEHGTHVKLCGISHFVTNYPSYAALQPTILRFRARYMLGHEDMLKDSAAASGVIFLQKLDDGRTKIHPMILVKETGTFIYETGCASGTLAAALVEARKLSDGIHEFSFIQPSGLPLTTKIKKENGKFIEAKLAGRAELYEWCTIDMPVSEHFVLNQAAVLI